MKDYREEQKKVIKSNVEQNVKNILKENSQPTKKI